MTTRIETDVDGEWLIVTGSAGAVTSRQLQRPSATWLQKTTSSTAADKHAVRVLSDAEADILAAVAAIKAKHKADFDAEREKIKPSSAQASTEPAKVK